MRLFVILCGFFFVASCCKEEAPFIIYDVNGVVISQNFFWKHNLHSDNVSHVNSSIHCPIIFANNILIPTTDANGNNFLTMIKTKNGEAVWQWNDFLPNYASPNSIDYTFVKDNLLTWQYGSKSYCVELETGTTMWKTNREASFYSHLNSYDNKYITYSSFQRDDGYFEHISFKGDIQSGELSLFLKAKLSGDYAAPYIGNGHIGGISYINVLSTLNLLLVTYDEPLPEWKIKMMFGLYNTETQEWVYERKLLVEPHWNAGVQHTPIIFNNRVYAAAGNSIVCHDVATGNQLWRREFEQDFLFSGFIIEDGKLIANCEDTYTYRLDPSTGATIWRTKGAGTCSRMSYLNGVAYFVGGSTGYLHAVDTENGQVLWRIDASRFESPQASFTTNAVYCIPGEGGAKGRVVALTGMYAYCFEAAR